MNSCHLLSLHGNYREIGLSWPWASENTVLIVHAHYTTRLLHYHQCNLSQATSTWSPSSSIWMQVVLVTLWDVFGWTKNSICEVCVMKRSLKLQYKYPASAVLCRRKHTKLWKNSEYQGQCWKKWKYMNSWYSPIRHGLHL